MTIININENYGDPVEFESINEMADAINNTEDLDTQIDAADLIEGVDYEIIIPE